MVRGNYVAHLQIICLRNRQSNLVCNSGNSFKKKAKTWIIVITLIMATVQEIYFVQTQFGIDSWTTFFTFGYVYSNWNQKLRFIRKDSIWNDNQMSSESMHRYKQTWPLIQDSLSHLWHIPQPEFGPLSPLFLWLVTRLLAFRSLLYDGNLPWPPLWNIFIFCYSWYSKNIWPGRGSC